MSTRRFITFLLGVWLGGSLFMYLVASHNLESADRVLGSPPAAAAKIIDSVGSDSARLLLRHQASELNRLCFEYWGLAQLIIGGAVFGMLLFATREGKWPVVIAFVMLVVVAAMRFILTPDLVNFGRQLDFVTKEAGAAEYARFWGVHRAYGIAELVKSGLGLALLGLLLFRVQRKRRSVHQVHAVDDADDRHIDR
jgi:hypothetical protein